MQQFCQYGSVRGATGNRRPYRDIAYTPELFLRQGAESTAEGTPDGFQRMMQNECARDQALIREGGIRAE